MFKKTSFLKQKLKKLSAKMFHLLENNGDCNFDKNGEKVFADNLLAIFKNKIVSGGRVVVFDIGANIGEYSQMFESKLHGLDIEINLFEPTKSCFFSSF